MTPTLALLVAASDAVAQTLVAQRETARLAELLRAVPPHERALAATYVAGEPRQRQTGVGPSAVYGLDVPPAAAPSLSLSDVDRALDALAAVGGAGAAQARRELLAGLLARATRDEADLLRRLLVGELRQGALERVVLDAIALAADVPSAAVRRAAMLRGDLGALAETALGEGLAGLLALGLVVGRPLQPMLAGSAPDVADALARTGPAAVDWKLDGVRIQAHRDGADVALFTRTLDDVTARMPEIVEAVLALPAQRLVLDGEAIALRADGTPRPFQETSSRVGRQTGIDAARAALPLTPYLFDLLHADGDDLLDAPAAERAARLEAIATPALRVPRTVVDDADAAEAVLAEALARGHEGVIVKALAAPYEAGRRGAGWLKVKPVRSLDLVVLAAEWGHGRRTGLLSNLHLGARDPVGGFVMVGKTFKGLTDALLAWQTEALLARAERTARHVVHVRPELVVEIAFDGVQASSRYPGGVALRFARVRGYRSDRTAADADTIDAVRAYLPG